jgi:hypothetical protein
MRRILAWVFIAFSLFSLGCEIKPGEKAQNASASSKRAAAPAKAESLSQRTVAKAALSSKSATVSATGLNLRAAIDQLKARWEESLSEGPGLVIWIIDSSKSTETLRTRALPMIEAIHAALAKLQPKSDLQVALISASEEAKWELEPASDLAALKSALEKIATNESPTENLLAAVKLASEKASQARRAGREATIVLLTDEAGDDGDLVDEVLIPLKKFGVTVFVLGNPAPFGRTSVSSSSIEGAEKLAGDIDPKVMHEGPESIEPEVIDLSFSGSDVSIDLFDSGFGPFALEKLCRVSGGRYFALRPGMEDLSFSGLETRWPDPSAPRFKPERMQAYAPTYETRAEYEALLSSNRAAKALVDAAKLSRIETLGAVNVRFEKSNEAQLKRRLDESQEAAAKLEPAISRLVEILLPGEPDRDRLPSARWKAGYDLALGRALAAKARVDGYNSMLAALKRGKNFQNPQSKTWRLDAENNATEAGSSIQAILKKADSILKRVIEEHAETPWAEMAKRELETPLGWKWTEE